jgi:hypothetical protein
MVAAAPTLTVRQLNRALLARQGLLERWTVPVEQVLGRLVGLQAQSPQAPFGALWARMTDFRPAQLDDLLIERRAVRMALMRSTLFLVTTEDCLGLRPVMASVGLRAINSTATKRTADLDLARLLGVSRSLLAERPLTLGELGAALAAEFPRWEPADLSLLARTHLPLVQPPPRGLWGQSAPARHVTAQAWLDRELPDGSVGSTDLDPADPAAAIRRYLAAFGPATVADAQAWSGLAGLRPAMERLRSSLRVFRDERARELFDVPDGLRPAADTPAPARILGEFDNVLLSHADRSRIFDESHRMRFMTQNGLVRSTLLLDGFVAGTCLVKKDERHASLSVSAYRKLSRAERTATLAEAARLLKLCAPGQEPRIDLQMG